MQIYSLIINEKFTYTPTILDTQYFIILMFEALLIYAKENTNVIHLD